MNNIKLETNLLNIKKSNLVFLIDDKKNLNLIKELKLNSKIINKINNFLKDWKNGILSFYLWEKNFEYIYILYYLDDTKISLLEFLWNEIPKISSKITLLANDKNLSFLLDSTLLSRYKFDKYKTEKINDEINIIVNDNIIDNINERLEVIENIILARDLWETPSNYLYPEEFCRIVKNTKFINTKIKIFNSKQIEKKWLNLLYSVWKWSEKWPYMVIFERIVNKDFPTIWLVWKWITFDTWWIQVKPWDYMYEMKWDMCWSACVYSIIKLLDKKELNINIIWCIVLAENHISWNSYKPSDIIKSYSWKTVDIIHTDAEWRLALADWISYISKNYKLNKVITIATLTWAVITALWYRYAWIMWNDKELIKKFINYSEKNFEKYIELPFDNYMIEKTKSSKVADLENLNLWVKAWSSMWAAFLSNFLLNNELFTHIDIAWTSINSYEPYWLFCKWMTWFWVDSLSSILLELK